MKNLLIQLYIKLLKRGHGLKPYTIGAEDWSLGAIKGEVLQSNGQWDEFLPEGELQKRLIETMSCTVYGTENCLGILHQKQYQEPHDRAERFNAILAGITPSGGSPHTAAETMRKYGTVEQNELPFDETINSWTKYFSPKPMTQQLLDKGREWLDNYELWHEWVKPNKQDMMEALKYSPLGAPVYAWSEHSDGMYYRDGQENHWICIYGYKEGEYWKVFDSYEPYEKKIPWDNNFGWALKRYSLTRVKSKIEIDEAYYKSMIGKLVMRVDTLNGAHGELYEIHTDHIEYISFSVSNKKVWDAVHKTLRPIIQGITEPEFSRLKRIATDIGGGVIENNLLIKIVEFFK